MRHRSKAARTTTLVAAVLALTACGGDDGTASESDGESESDAATGSDDTTDTGTSPPVTTKGEGSTTTGGEIVPPVAVCDVDDGQCIFRHETFGDEQHWTDLLRLHELANGLAPTAALGVGLKVDADAVPADVLASADLEDPATTVALLELDAVVGLHATVTDGVVERIGVTCSLCHATVDDAVAPGIGSRLDGWANRDLNVGAILALTPGLPDFADVLGVDVGDLEDALGTWGPGKYDAVFTQDGTSDPVLIPPAFGLDGVALETYVGDGEVSYWNAYVAVTQMGAHGNFKSDELGLDITHDPDLVTPRLDALRDYQLSLPAPSPPPDSFDADAAARGGDLFTGIAGCADCHAGTVFTDAPTLHTPEETGVDPARAMRSVTGLYRTTPLRGAWAHPPYFHDGSASTLDDVVDHYDTLFGIGLSDSESGDLVEYLKSL